MSEPNITNLDELTARIYQDGIEKAEEQSRKILGEANDKQQEMIAHAEAEASKILSEARREAERLNKSVENELRLKGKQFVSDLKREIKDLIGKQMISANVNEAFLDKDFLKKAILEAIGYWKEDRLMTLTLPEKLRAQLDKAFEKSLAKNLDGLTIRFDGDLDGGFKVKRDADDFEITFAEQDFNTLFQRYLSESAETLIFKS